MSSRSWTSVTHESVGFKRAGAQIPLLTKFRWNSGKIRFKVEEGRDPRREGPAHLCVGLAYG